MKLNRKIRRSKKARIHMPPRSTVLVLTASGGDLQMTIRGPAQPATSGPGREVDIALRKLAQEAMNHLREVLKEPTEDTIASECHDNAREEADGAGSAVHQG